jgi:hypothetical protein
MRPVIYRAIGAIEVNKLVGTPPEAGIGGGDRAHFGNFAIASLSWWIS